MKKVLAATAGLMLVGGVASSAFADAANITFSGDARVRYYYQDNYAGVKKLLPTESKDTHWDDRVRLQFQINAKGGAYAVGRFRLANSNWDGTQKTIGTGDKSNLYVDKGYIGVPMGPIVVEGGMGYNTFPELYRADNDADFIRAIYKTDNTNLNVFFEKWDEYQEGTTSSIDATTGLSVTKTTIDTLPNGTSTDDDSDQYGFMLTQKINPSWAVNVMGVYRNNEQVTTDETGIGADVSVVGKAGNIDVLVEAAYKENYISGTPVASTNKDGSTNPADNGMALLVGAKVPAGPASIAIAGGMTKDGFVAGEHLGDTNGYVPFVMLSGDNTTVTGMLNTGVLVGAGGDWTWVNVAPTFKVNESLSLMAEATYGNVDPEAGSGIGVIELGGKATYTISDGATFTFLAGYLDIEDADKNPLACGLALDIKY